MTKLKNKLNENACYLGMMINTLDDQEFKACYGETRDRVKMHAAWLEMLTKEYERNPHPATLDAMRYVLDWLENVARLRRGNG